MKKFRKLSIKILLGVVPFFIIAVSVLTTISTRISSNIIDNEITAEMNAELNSNINGILTNLDKVRTTATVLTRFMDAYYNDIAADDFGKSFEEIVADNELVLGCGVWFEPYACNDKDKYTGIYWYRDGSNVEVTYDYNTEEYDYFSQEYYLNAKNAKSADPIITDPYYDETLDITMSTCSAPVYDNGRFIGCVTVDMSLETIQQLVEAIRIKENGRAILTTAEGIYISCDDHNKVSQNVNIKSDDNASLSENVSAVFENEHGDFIYSIDGDEYIMFYAPVPDLNWKLMLNIEKDEIQEPIERLLSIMTIVGTVVLVLCVIVLLIQIGKISGGLGKVTKFASTLASGDFTVQLLKKESEDELGQMSNSLNNMYQNNRDIISAIAENSSNIQDSAGELGKATEQLTEVFGSIREYMNEINDTMFTASSAAEEVNASTEEVSASVAVLAETTQQNRVESRQISDEANRVRELSEKAHQNAIAISESREHELQQAVENAKVVENIGVLATVISSIAEEINLLSLNASIEAARAGEQGRGFAVVATEIGKLAGDTSKTVNEIQTTIREVQDAFSNMSKSSMDIIEFIKNTVTPDYGKFVDVANSYGEAANKFGKISDKIQEMTENIEHVMSEVTDAVQGIAESSQKTSSDTANIMSSVNDMSSVIDNVADMSSNQEAIANELNSIVSKFRL